MEDFSSVLRREQAIEEILLSNDEATQKVKRLKSMGLDEETSEEMVGNYQTGQMAPVYYERLEFDDDQSAEVDIDS